MPKAPATLEDQKEMAKIYEILIRMWAAKEDFADQLTIMWTSPTRVTTNLDELLIERETKKGKNKKAAKKVWTKGNNKAFKKAKKTQMRFRTLRKHEYVKDFEDFLDQYVYKNKEVTIKKKKDSEEDMKEKIKREYEAMNNQRSQSGIYKE